MREIIFEAIIWFFVEVLFGKILLTLLKGIKPIGLMILKLVTFSKKPIKKLDDFYKGSSKPYFLGFGAIIGIIYLIIQLIKLS